MKRPDLVKTFNDTMERIEINDVLWNKMKESYEKSVVYDEYAEISLDQSKISRKKGEIKIVPATSFDAARNILDEIGLDKKVAVLNFANAFYPGGGVTRGATAQEECLCRCSTLYLCLLKISKSERFYKKHMMEKIMNKNKLDQSGIIYTPDVAIIKTDDYELLEHIVTADVITAAAPELFRFNSIDEKELFDLFLDKIEAIVRLAINNGCDAIVLGAFGCGAFKNPPELVAKAFKKVLEKNISSDCQMKQCFEQVVFAIRARRGKENLNYRVFERVLSD